MLYAKEYELNIVIFLILFTAYFGCCLVAVKLHKHVADKLKTVKKQEWFNLLAQYFWFLLFIVPYIPFSIFFPAWLNSQVRVLQESKNVTGILILVGCFTLAITMWLGYKKSKQNNW